MGRKVTVLIADNGEIFRGAVATILANEDGIKVVSTCATGVEAINKVVNLKPDVILVDKYIPESNFIKVSQHIRKTLPETRIIITQPYKDADPLSSLKAEADGYIDKDIPVGILLGVIKRVHMGETYLSPDIATRVLQEFCRVTKNMDEGQLVIETELTTREIEVLKLITDKGMTNQEIADTLHITLGTVRSHISNILSKLHVNSRLQAALWAREKRL